MFASCATNYESLKIVGGIITDLVNCAVEDGESRCRRDEAMTVDSTTAPAVHPCVDAVSATVAATSDIEVISIDDPSPVKKKTRRSYTFKEKAEVIKRYYEILEQDGDTSYKVMEEILNVPKPLIHKWVTKEKDSIIAKAADETLCYLRKGRPTKRHNATFVLLHKEFLNARNQGKRVNFAWLWVKGRAIAIRENYPKFTRSATQSYLRAYKVKLRTVQRTKQIPQQAFEEKIRNWHVKYRETVIKSGSHKSDYDSKYGRFGPSRRFNVDQVRIH